MKAPTVLKAPCAKCPFRSDVPIYLRAGRREDIARGLHRGEPRVRPRSLRGRRLRACHMPCVSLPAPADGACRGSADDGAEFACAEHCETCR